MSETQETNPVQDLIKYSIDQDFTKASKAFFSSSLVAHFIISFTQLFSAKIIIPIPTTSLIVALCCNAMKPTHDAVAGRRDCKRIN